MIIIGLALLAGALSGVPAETTPNFGDTGSVQGRITYSSEIPKPTKLLVIKDVKVCAKIDHYDDRLVVGSDSGINNVVVSLVGVEGGKSIDSLGTEFVLDQKFCAYDPHVLIVPVNKQIKILNSDGILHNIHTYGKQNPSVNLAQPRFKKKLKLTLEKPEKVQVRCDVHGWMSAWFVVVEHAYYTVTDSTGEFSLTGVPPGTYTLNIWQELLGSKEVQVTIKAGEESELNFSFEAVEESD